MTSRTGKCYQNCYRPTSSRSARNAFPLVRVEPPWGVEPQTYALRVRLPEVSRRPLESI